MPAIKAEVEAEGEGADTSAAAVTQRAIERLFEQPIAEDITQLECTDYTDQEIQNDIDAVDWEVAHEEVQEMERQKQQAHLELQLERERLKAQE